MESPTLNHNDDSELGIQLPSADYKIMVLLVDDQAMVGEAIRRALLSESDIDFHYCPRAEDAVRVAEKTQPTVILQDLVMPGVDGLTLVKQYRSNPLTMDIPIIVLSSKEDALVKRDAFATGVNDYMVKLPDTIELIARIRYHSRSYNNQLQRDAAYRALRESQQQLQKTNFELQRLTNTDGLTGIANRRYFDDYLNAEWKRAKRVQQEISLLIIDVDNFKLYNDNYGHVAGDQVLKSVARAMEASAVRSSDLSARFGGEEFTVILPSTDDAGAIAAGEKLREMVEALHIGHAHSTTGEWLTVSVGVATMIPKDEQTQSDLIRLADKRLYKAKQQGKNRVISTGD
ncbi:diguanylate cyclase [Herbaspirillum rhizosphaerae]|uniref:diguanylate cyclase n=1 Tax=Herbaspirillum rhizosphaerae TaxID=346179 RepID=UPI00067AF43A|nr:diguanylate cyclase [Herbaspirillum rhizosphaerae]